jgi:hypothetical protein
MQITTSNLNRRNLNILGKIMFQPFMKTTLVVTCSGKGISNDLWEVDRLLKVAVLVVTVCIMTSRTSLKQAQIGVWIIKAV